MTQCLKQIVNINEDTKKKQSTVMLLPIIHPSLNINDTIIGFHCNCRISMQDKKTCSYCWKLSNLKLTENNKTLVTITYSEFKNFVFNTNELKFYCKKNNKILMTIEKIIQNNKTCMYYNIFLHECKASLDDSGNPYKYTLRYHTFNKVVSDIFSRIKKISIQRKKTNLYNYLLNENISPDKNNNNLKLNTNFQHLYNESANDISTDDEENKYFNFSNNKFQ